MSYFDEKLLFEHQGDQGVPGNQGDKGDTGDKGDKGDTGDQGIQGIPGNPGFGRYDPRDYGAVMDGLTDDFAAFQALEADIPRTGGIVFMSGFSWLSDTWRVSKQIRIVGFGGNRADPPCSGIEVAPGREAALALDFIGISDGSSSALKHLVDSITLRSRIMIHPIANGTSGGATASACLKQWANTARVRLGDVFVAGSGASPTRCFRCIITGLGAAAGTFDNTQPTWNTTIGGTTVHGGMTFITEAVINPVTHLTNHAYVLGERVFAVDDNRYVFECTQAGTSSVTAPTEFNGGFSLFGVQVGQVITDGSAQWTAAIMAGVYVSSPQGKLKLVEAQGFTTYGIHIQGGTTQDVRVAATNSDNFRVEDPYITWCGGGIYVVGDDANGWTIDNPVCDLLGWFHPHPWTTIYTEIGTGGHAVHDRSLGGGMLSNLYLQASTGRPMFKSSGSSRVTMLACNDESLNSCWSAGPNVVCIGGNVVWHPASVGVMQIDFDRGHGLIEYMNDGTQSLQGRIISNPSFNAGLFRMSHQSEDSGQFWSWSYGSTVAGGGRSGYWSHYRGDFSPNVAVLASTAGASTGLDPCPGWYVYGNGFLVGDPADLTKVCFRGPYTQLRRNHLRNGKRRKGDEFSDAGVTYKLTSDGYFGIPWTALTLFGKSVIASGTPANIIEPTANTFTAAGGGKVFECTADGTTGSSEPNWSTATNPGDTVSDGSTVWTLLGTTPSFNRISGGVVVSEPAITVQAKNTWADTSDTDSPGAPTVSVESIRATGSNTSGATADQQVYMLTVVSAASGKRDVFEVDALIMGGGTNGQATAKLFRSFHIDDAGAVTALDAAVTSVSSKNDLSGMSDSDVKIQSTGAANQVQFTVTPTGASGTYKWGIVIQTAKKTGVDG
jgi:hypothetical protein